MSAQFNTNNRPYFFAGHPHSTLDKTHPHIPDGGCASLIHPTSTHSRLFIPHIPVLHPASRSTRVQVQKGFRHFCVCICGLIFSFNIQPTFADTTQPSIRDLDRLFTTRHERAQLDSLRQRMAGGEMLTAASTETSTPPAIVKMQGIMQREKGKTVTWINGQSTLNSNHIDDHIRVTGQPQALRGANLNIDGQAVHLKPGQVWQPETGQIVESYKTKVATPLTKGAAETVPDVQTETAAEKEIPAAVKPVTEKTEVKQTKP